MASGCTGFDEVLVESQRNMVHSVAAKKMRFKITES